MIPLFKSHYSIGKSILTLEEPSPPNGSSDSVFDIVQEHELKEVVMVEDTFMGFLQANKVCKSMGVNFRFGLRVDIVDESFDPEDKKTPKHKLILFAKSSQGCKCLFKIYSHLKSSEISAITLTDLKSLWDGDHLDLVVPFYDSFLFCNLFLFNSFVVDLSFFKPDFFIEYNGLPFDLILKNNIEKYALNNSCSIHQVKSIFYKNREDFEAFQTYKLICSRSSFASRRSSLEKPNLDHMGSKEFCYESFLEQS
jgi:DNA polymerase III alpha subunit